MAAHLGEPGKGLFSALSVTATRINVGRTIVFVQRKEGRVPSWKRDPRTEARETIIGPEHALASGAISLLFRSVRIGEEFFCDGSLRQNTPLSPALRLGADRVLVLTLRHKPAVPPSNTRTRCNLTSRAARAGARRSPCRRRADVARRAAGRGHAPRPHPYDRRAVDDVGPGLGLSAVSFGTLGVALREIDDFSRAPPMRAFRGTALAPFSVQIIAIFHGVYALGTLIAGVFWLPSRANGAELARLQQQRVRERITELEASGATYDRARVAAERAELLTAAEPSYALPSHLMAAGLLSTLTGIATLALFYGEPSYTALTAGAVEGVVGVALVAVASWLFYRYGQERAWLRARRAWP